MAPIRKTFWIGTKSGSRRMFADEGVAHPLGIENLKSIEEVARAIAEMRAQKPALRQVLVKLNEGVSGEGNALVDLEGLTFPGDFRARDDSATAAIDEVRIAGRDL